MEKQTKSYLLALGTITLWSTISSASKLTLRYIPPAAVLFYASLVSTLVLFIILAAQRKIAGLRLMSAKDWLLSAGFGVINPFAYYLVLFKAYDKLPAQQAQIINYTWAITLSLLSIPVLKQKVSVLQWLAIGCCYCGVLVIATDGDIFAMDFKNPEGIWLALLSTILWALYWILNTKDGREPVVGLFLNFLCALPVVGFYYFVVEKGGMVPVAGFIGAAYIGVFEMGVSFVLWLLALKYSSSTAKIANLIFLSPFISLFFIHHVVGEPIYVSTVIGLICVFIGLGIQSYGNWRASSAAS